MMTRHGHAFKPKRKVDGSHKSDTGKKTAKHPFSLFTESLGRARRSGDNLESSHKQAWRFYSHLFIFLVNIFFYDIAFAEVSTKTQMAAETVSSETAVSKKVILVPKPAAKTVVTTKKSLSNMGSRSEEHTSELQ